MKFSEDDKKCFKKTVNYDLKNFLKSHGLMLWKAMEAINQI